MRAETRPAPPTASAAGLPVRRSPAFPLPSLSLPLPGSLRGPAEEAERTARPPPPVWTRTGGKGTDAPTPVAHTPGGRIPGSLGPREWDPGASPRLGGGVRWGAGPVTFRLCGPRSFLDLLPSLIQFPLCREPHKRRTSGTRRVLGGAVPDLVCPRSDPRLCLRLNQNASLTLGPSCAPGGLGHLGPSHSPASVSPSGWARGLQAARPEGPRVWLGSFPCRWGLGGGSVARLWLLKGLRVLWPVGSAASPGRGARFPAGTGLREGPLRRKCQPSVRVAVAFGPLGGCALQGRRG